MFVSIFSTIKKTIYQKRKPNTLFLTSHWTILPKTSQHYSKKPPNPHQPKTPTSKISHNNHKTHPTLHHPEKIPNNQTRTTKPQRPPALEPPQTPEGCCTWPKSSTSSTQFYPETHNTNTPHNNEHEWDRLSHGAVVRARVLVRERLCYGRLTARIRHVNVLPRTWCRCVVMGVCRILWRMVSVLLTVNCRFVWAVVWEVCRI